MNLPDPLVVFALRMESQDLFERAEIPVLYCGVGKVNAAAALTRRLAEYRHAGRRLPRVINFGTVGSAKFPTGTVVACHRFVQRDMDVTGLGFAPGETPYDDLPGQLEFPVTCPDLPAAVCGTGDSFQTAACPVPCDVVDMEAYALAKVCTQENAEFVCIKYVTDGADHAAADDWRENLHRAADEFLAWYHRLTQR